MRLFSVVRVGEGDDSFIRTVSDEVGTQFDADIRFDGAMRLPSESFDEKRNQHNAVVIVRALAGLPLNGAERIFAVASVDMFIPMLTFVFGLAHFEGNTALISTARLKPEFYGLPPNDEQLYARAAKEAMHELGHTYGLVHCSDRTCQMALSTNIMQLDLKRNEFCRTCSLLLRDRFSRILS